jgi:hypothetical protein
MKGKKAYPRTALSIKSWQHRSGIYVSTNSYRIVSNSIKNYTDMLLVSPFQGNEEDLYNENMR